MTAYMIGVDIGTTSTKAVVFTLDGEVVSHHAVDYPLLHPVPAAAEQDPNEIFRAVCEAMRVSVAGMRVPTARDDIVCVAFSAAMHSVMAVDASDQPLTRSITWADNRAAPWAERIRHSAAGSGIYRRTGTPIHPMSPLCKLAWLHDEQAETCARAARFVGIKEYVFHRLFGTWVVDHSIASATGLLNLAQLGWDDEALSVARVRSDQLSTLVPTTHHLRGLAPDMARHLGIDQDTPFVVGASDGVLSNLGVDALHAGELAVTIGTSGAIRTVVDQPSTDPEGRTFCYALTERHWVIGGPVNNGGVVLQWMRDEFAAAESEAAKRDGVDPYDMLMHLAERIPAGAEGLLFHPYLTGERAPFWDANLRGSFFGLAMHHHKAHMIRAVLEGVVFNLCSILPAVESMVGTSRRIKATGGFARSAVWRQMVADIFDRDVVVPASFESSALGAAVLGLFALGRVDSLDVVADMVGETHRHAPIAQNVARYQRLLPIFMALPKQLQEQYRLISAIQREAAPPAAR